MEITQYFSDLVGKEEGTNLEYKATLIPSRAIAQILASFANTEGGSLIFGVRERARKKMEVQGLSSDFNVQGIVIKALGFLQPFPKVTYSYFSHSNKQLFGINVQRSAERIMVEGQFYKRDGDKTINPFEDANRPKQLKVSQFEEFKLELDQDRKKATSPKTRLISHYLNILNLYESVFNSIYQGTVNEKTNSSEGKVLNRILFTSCIDNFETYLAELLYEIYLAKPETLKGGDSNVKVADVLVCADIEEFIQRYAAKRISKLQKGSIKGFIKENPEISGLEALTNEQITEIEKILQIRHLYTHKNGIVDEQFLTYFRGLYQLNDEHQFSILEVIEKLKYLMAIIKNIDLAANAKYSLSIMA